MSTEEVPHDIALEAVDVTKHFGGIKALQNVSVRIERSTCHAIVGANGAGKSTLMKTLAGLYPLTSGHVYADGQKMDANPSAARQAGIALVHQELSLCPDLSVAENIFIGDQPMKYGHIHRSAMRDQARALCDRLGISLDPESLVGELPTTLQQYVEIAKALRLNPQTLILDEPTASLTPQDADKLIKLLHSLRDDGVTIVFISHRIREIFSLCTRATVLRSGRVAEHTELTNSSPDELVEVMVGKKLAQASEVSRRNSTELGEVVLTVEGLCAPQVKNTSLSVSEGEIVGVGGLMGSGRSELIRAILGIERSTAGTVKIYNKGRWTPLSSYHRAVRNRVAYVPEDRRTDGVLLDRTIRENIALPSLRRLGVLGYVGGRKVRQLAESIALSVNLQPQSTTGFVKQLSGGNQQKVAFGRWLPSKPLLFVLDEPTAGVDVGAKSEIHALIKDLARNGTSVILVSSDLEELLALSDRIVVIRDGALVGELSGKDATEEAIVNLGTFDSSVTKG